MSEIEILSAEALAQMSLADLKTLEKRVTKAIVTFEERQKLAALKAVEEKAREMGFSLSELTGVASGSGRGKSKTAGIPKYANPSDPTQTWTGKGRRPDWFVAAVDSGKSPEDLEI
jgi:DNA-binding protein H-NS